MPVTSTASLKKGSQTVLGAYRGATPAYNALGFYRNFAQLKTLNHGTGPAITFTRASNATYFDAAGVLQTAANDVPRFDHDPATGASRGLLIEEARTNSIRNSQAGGLSAGTPGTSPTNWAITGSGNGITRQIVGTGSESGFTYIDIKYSGTPTNSDTLRIAAEPSNQIAALNGQTWTSSLYVKLEGGALTNVVVRNAVAGFDSTPTFIAGQAATTTITPTSAGLALQRSSATFAFTSASIAFVRNELLVDYTSGNPIDLTLRIAAPQLELGAFATSYIPTTTVAVERKADSAIVTPISSFYNQAEGTLFAEASSFSSAANASSVALTAGGSADERLQLRVRGSAVSIVAAATNSFVSASSDPAANVANKRAAAAKLNDFAVSTNGAAVETDTVGNMPTVTHLVCGALSTGLSQPLNGHIRKLAYYPKRLSNALLQQLTT